MNPDVVVIGAGNAALVSALSAHEAGAKVLICEAATEEAMGGNSRFTFAGFRFGVDRPDDVRSLIPDINDDDLALVRNKPYTPKDFYDNLMMLSNGEADEELCKMLSESSFDVLSWMSSDLGIQWDLSMSGLPKEPLWRLSPGSVFAQGRGKGLIEKLLQAVQDRNIEIRYGTSLDRIVHDRAGVTGAIFDSRGEKVEIKCNSIVLACGSFEASKIMRRKHMGDGWANMKVRGTRFNTGKGLKAAFAVGAQPYGNWAGGHGVPVDARSKDFGELALGETTRRCLFQYSISVDENGRRFMDEGEDRKTFMYGKTGVAIANQENHRAFQIFDAKIMTSNFEKLFYFSSNYYVAQTLDELADMINVPKDVFLEELDRYNSAIDLTKEFDTSILDGRSAKGITPPRSNYAISIDMPPYFAFPVKGGITFAYGGIKTNTRSQVLDSNDTPIRGLYAAGEMAGGYFIDSYPANAGLARGAVTGYNAGKNLEL